jgi:2-polyprenyl-3-methyl-5-hydroxy-6-metoxy-1,4-benzoquinol methylase
VKTFGTAPVQDEPARLIQCVICDSPDAEPHWDCGAFAFVKCRQCGHVYQNPQPHPAALIARYDQAYCEYEVENDRNFLNLMLLGLADVRFFSRLEATHSHPSLLDVGCATGALLECAAQRGYSVQGVEVCEPAARYGIERRSVPIEVGTLGSVSLPSSRYSAVHFSHVIEHVPDPRGFLAEVRRYMHHRGLGVVVTPNSDGLQARLFGEQWRSAIADHVHLFRKRNLVRLLGECGFSVIATKTWGGLGIGTAAPWLKKPADRLAKVFGFGDVVLVLFTPSDRDS